MKPKAEKLVQICAPSVPVFAVFSEQQPPTLPEHLFLVPCPVVGMFESSDGIPDVVGLVIEDWGLDRPSGENFCGYAHSKDDANQYVVSKSPEQL